jgi:DNA-binding NarL/FixJ family response regulator
LRCVIIDDSPEFIVAAINTLECAGIKVVGVTMDGEEALRCIEAVKPDITLIDIDLGPECGFDVAGPLHERAGAAAQSTLIMMSAHPIEDFADILAARPAVGFITKSSLSAQAIHALLEDR